MDKSAVGVAGALEDGTYVSDSAPAIDDLLFDLRQPPFTFDDFRSFMVREMAEENIDYWQATEAFRQTFGKVRAPKIVRLAKNMNAEGTVRGIIDEYVSPNAPREINLPYEMRNQIVQNQTGVNVTVFDESQEEVKKLMEVNSYSRFLAVSSKQNITESQSVFRKKVGYVFFFLSVAYAAGIIALEEAGILKTYFLRVLDFIFLFIATSYFLSGKKKV